MVIKLKQGGMAEGGVDINNAVRELAQQNAHILANGVADLTNNAGGSAGSIVAITDFSNVAASGSNLADKTETEAALNLVKDALLELATKANAVASVLGIEELTYNGGGTSADGTILAITVSVAGATTGVQATEMNATKDALDNATYQVAILINKLCAACGLDKVDIGYQRVIVDPVTAITVAGGSAADPGVTKAAVDTALVVYQTNIKTLGDKLVAMANTAAKAKVIAQ